MPAIAPNPAETAAAVASVAARAAANPVTEMSDTDIDNSLGNVFDAVEKTPAVAPSDIAKPLPPKNKPGIKAEPAEQIPAKAKEEPAKQEAVTEKPVVDEVESFKEKLTDHSKNRFTELARKEAERIAEDRLKEYVAKNGDSAVLSAKAQELQAKLEEAETYLQTVAIEKSDLYRKTVAEPEAMSLKALDAVAQRAEISPSKLREAVNAPDSKEARETLAEIMGGMNEFDKADLLQARRDLLAIGDKKKTLLDHPQQALKVHEETRKAQFNEWQEGQIKERLAELGKSVESFKEGAPELYEEGNESALAQVKELSENLLKRGLGELNPATQAKLVATATAAGPVVKSLRARLDKQAGEIATLTERLAQYDKADPDLSSGQGTPKAPAVNPDLDYDNVMKGLGLT